MKKYILTLGIFFGLVGCSDDYYESLNVDTSNPSEVPAGFLVTYATTSLFHQMYNQNVNLNVFRFFSQYLTTTTYTDEPNYDLETRNIPGNHWNRLYTRVLNNLKDARSIVEADLTSAPEKIANQLAIIDILEVYTYQVLVDTFGNVPYSEALMGLENQFPKYDDASEIYNDLFSRISADISTLNPNFGGFGDNDIIYNDDISAWKKMAASLQLRMAVQVMDVNSNAAGYVQQALAAGVFSSNDDNFQLNYLSAAPYTNPVYEDLVLSGRQDYLPANTIVDYMNGLNDPRREVYFQDVNGAYIGGPYGTSIPGGTYNDFSHEGEIFYTATMPGVLLDYAEVEFLQAEFYMKTGNSGLAKAHYEAGILANMDFWGIDTAAATAYVAANPWDGANSAQLAMQFWLGEYDRGWTGWNVWRRFDSPIMNVAIDFGEPIPTRYTYPLSESSLNPDAYGQAASAIGGDTKTTKLFWDIH